MSYDIITLRTALIITLVLVLIGMIVQRIRRRVYEASIPAISHVELLSLEVVYHPSRLHVVVKVPNGQTIRTSLLDERYQESFSWPERQLDKGIHTLERTLPAVDNGTYYLEVSTATQRTVRQFRLQ